MRMRPLRSLVDYSQNAIGGPAGQNEAILAVVQVDHGEGILARFLRVFEANSVLSVIGLGLSRIPFKVIVHNSNV